MEIWYVFSRSIPGFRINWIMHSLSTIHKGKILCNYLWGTVLRAKLKKTYHPFWSLLHIILELVCVNPDFFLIYMVQGTWMAPVHNTWPHVAILTAFFFTFSYCGQELETLYFIIWHVRRAHYTNPNNVCFGQWHRVQRRHIRNYCSEILFWID